MDATILAIALGAIGFFSSVIASIVFLRRKTSEVKFTSIRTTEIDSSASSRIRRAIDVEGSDISILINRDERLSNEDIEELVNIISDSESKRIRLKGQDNV